MDKLEPCLFCGSTTVRLNFKRQPNCFPKKVMDGGCAKWVKNNNLYSNYYANKVMERKYNVDLEESV